MDVLHILGNTADIAPFDISFQREYYWHNKVNAALDNQKLGRVDMAKLKSLLFAPAMPEHLPLSNQHVRHASRQAFADIVTDAVTTDASRLYLVTLAGARGVTALRRPRMDLVRFQRAADAALRHRGLAGVFSFEFDIVKPLPGHADHLVLFHCHGVVRPTDPAILKFADMKAGLAACRAFPAWDGAVGAHIKPVSRTQLDAQRLGVYFADPVHQLKRVQPSRHQPGRNRMRSTRAGFTSALALRGTEIQSYLPIRDTVFGVGTYGAKLRAEWWQRFQAYLPREAFNGPAINLGDLSRLWQRLRRQDGSIQRYRPVSIITRSSAHRDRTG